VGVPGAPAPCMKARHRLRWQRVHGVDGRQPRVLHQGERRDTEEGVKDVAHVLWPVRNAAPVLVLRGTRPQGRLSAAEAFLHTSPQNPGPTSTKSGVN